MTVYGNGMQTRCFTHVCDAVHGVVLLNDAGGGKRNVYRIGSSEEIPIVELARRVIERAESESRIRLVPYEQACGELGRRVHDTSALERLAAWTANRTVDEAIDDAISYHRSGGRTAEAGSVGIAG